MKRRMRAVGNIFIYNTSKLGQSFAICIFSGCLQIGLGIVYSTKKYHKFSKITKYYSKVFHTEKMFSTVSRDYDTYNGWEDWSEFSWGFSDLIYKDSKIRNFSRLAESRMEKFSNLNI